MLQSPPSTVVTITGATGAGKSTLLTGLLDRLPGWRHVPSSSTRALRASERQGRDLCHVTRSDYGRLLRAGALLAPVRYAGEAYGLEVARLVRAAATAPGILVIVEPSGLRALQMWCAQRSASLRSVFLQVEASLAQTRLDTRGSDPIRRTLAATEVDVWRNAWPWDRVVNGASASDADTLERLSAWMRTTANSEIMACPSPPRSPSPHRRPASAR